MRLSIVLAICFLGVASASSFTKRSFLDDLQNKTQDAFHNLEHLGQDFNQKLQDALKNLFGDHSAEKTVEKRATNPLQLVNDLKDPAKFAQDLIKILSEMALQGRRKRDVSEDLKKIADAGKEKIQAAIKQLHDLFEQFKGGFNSDKDSKTVEKRATNPLQLVNDLKDPAKFAQDLVKMLAEMALQGRRKRDLAEDLKKFAEAGKQQAQDALKKLMDLFNSLKNQGASNAASDEATVSKRDVSEELNKIAAAGKEKLDAALKQLQDLFEQFKGGFNHDQHSATVTKRDVTESLKRFGQAAQEKTQSAFQHIKDALSSLFGIKPAAPVEEVEESTEVSVSKRSIADFQKFGQSLEQQAQEALSGFKNAFSNFFGAFRPKPSKPVAEPVEDTTESS